MLLLLLLFRITHPIHIDDSDWIRGTYAVMPFQLHTAASELNDEKGTRRRGEREIESRSDSIDPQ